MTNPTEWDVAIAGAGTAGSAAALHCARLGLSTICLDNNAHHQAGAHWQNAVPGWMFKEAGLARPADQELIGGGEPFHLFAGTGSTSITINGLDLLDVDMARLVARLQRLAIDKGAQFRGSTRIRGLSEDGLVTDNGVVKARWYVDASGMTGARLLDQPRVKPGDICSAAQEVRTVADMAEARRFFAKRGAVAGEAVAFTAIAGGFSTLNVRMDGDQVALLTGSIPANGHPSGQRMMSEFAAAQPWIGRKVSGGHRAIPLRRPYDRLANDRVALIGDAACQVYPAHGSGIGPGLIAARVLAEELGGGGSAHSYEVRWMRQWGPTLVSADQFRRYSETLDARTLARLLSSGLINASTAGRALAERLPAPSVGAARLMAIGAVREPILAAKLGQVLARSSALVALYSQYPSQPAALPAWSRAVAVAAALR
jgi:flavin-dependent dehydrogenase